MRVIAIAGVLAGLGAAGCGEPSRDVCRDFPGGGGGGGGGGGWARRGGVGLRERRGGGGGRGGAGVLAGPVVVPGLVAVHGFEGKGVRSPQVRRVDLLLSDGAQVVSTKQVLLQQWPEGAHLAASVQVP